MKDNLKNGLLKFYKAYKLILTSCLSTPLIVMRKKLIENPLYRIYIEYIGYIGYIGYIQPAAVVRSAFGNEEFYRNYVRSRVGKRNSLLLHYLIAVPWFRASKHQITKTWLNLAYEPAFWFSTTLGPPLFLPHISRIFTKTPINNICSFLQCCHGALATGMPYIGKWEQAQYRGRADPRWICRFSKSHPQLPLLRHSGNCFFFPLEEEKRCKKLSSCGQACKSNETITKRCGQLKWPLFCDPWGREGLWPLSLLVDYASRPPLPPSSSQSSLISIIVYEEHVSTWS